MIGYLLGVILAIEAVLLMIPMAVAAGSGESILPYLSTILIISAFSIPAILQRPKNRLFYAKEGFVTVAGGWILLSLFGALPFVFSGAIPHFIDAFFETVSGLTTTGATILSEIESLPRGILFWRSFTHWVGGMGVLVFMLAILPTAEGGSAIYLMRAEVPGPTKGKLVPKMKKTAMILYGIYIFLTAVQIIALLLCKMPFYDATVNAFATAGTGGFAVLNESIAGYANPAAEWVIAVFMLLFGINFNLYFFILIGQVRDVFRNEEFRAYLLIVSVATAAITVNIVTSFNNVGDGIRAAFFQVTSIMSTTGFTTQNYDLWPAFSKAVLLLLMIVGASAGSTAGGLKVSRVIILLKSVVREIRHVLRPRSVNVVRLDKKVVPDETVRAAGSYLAIYFVVVVAVFLLVSIDGGTVESNLSATLACVNNVGPGFGAVGPMGHFGAYSVLSKLALSAGMLIGRLEIMPLMILFSPSTWRRH